MENVACTGEMTNAYKIFIGNSQRLRPHGRSGQTSKESTNLDLGNTWCDNVKWIQPGEISQWRK